MNKSNQSGLVKNSRLMTYLLNILRITILEFKHIFRDSGVMIILIAAPLIYPLLYCSIYRNEVLTNVPIAVIDNCQNNSSRELIRRIDATPELEISSQVMSFDEIKELINRQQIHGAIYIPSDFSAKLAKSEQATISMYSDMSSFMYYRSIMTAVNYTVLKTGKEIQIKRLNELGVNGEDATKLSTPIGHKETILYNEGAGFASFLMPAILILILHQTLFFGIGMLAGTFREENKFHQLIINKGDRKRISQVITGKAICYISLYLILTTYILGVIPRLFNLPHIGNPMDILIFAIPFLLAVIFFSMTISVFIRNRETGLVVFLFCSLILLFLSGFSWPESNISSFWKGVSAIFPSTFGIQAYLKINTMGATLHEIQREITGLLIQTVVYFLTTILVYRFQISESFKKSNLQSVENENI